AMDTWRRPDRESRRSHMPGWWRIRPTFWAPGVNGRLGASRGRPSRWLAAQSTTTLGSNARVVPVHLGPLAACAHITPSSRRVLAEVYKQPAAVAESRALSHPVKRPVDQDIDGGADHRP